MYHEKTHLRESSTTATNGQKIIVALSPNSLVDLSTFEMNFVGTTQHRGNNTATNVANYVQKHISHVIQLR